MSKFFRAVHEFVQQRGRFIWRLHRSSLIPFWLTLFLVTAVLPGVAQYPPIAFRAGLPGERSQIGQSIDNPNLQNPNALTAIEQGKTLYEAGKFSEAAAVWQQAARDYEARGDRINQALSLNYLCLAYQNLGQWQDAQQALAQSLALLTNNKQPTTKNKRLLAQALNTQGSLQLAMGQTEAALNSWKQAENAYAEAGDEAGMLGSQINQAQALQTLGLYRQAQKTLALVNERLQSQPDSLLKATGLRSLGAALQVVGDLKKSQEVLEQSLAIAQRLSSSSDSSAAFFSLGNTARSLQDYPKAIKYYQQAAANATNSISKLEAQLNQLSLLVQTQDWKAVAVLLPQVQSQLAELPPSRAAVFAHVNLAESLAKMRNRAEGTSNRQEEIRNREEEQDQQIRRRSRNLPPSPSPNPNRQEVAQLLVRAIQQARTVKDPRAESYALGELGRLYEQSQQWADAQKLTQEALTLAQAINASDIAYRWQWQLGRILKQQGNSNGAMPQARHDASIAAYAEAVNTLQSLRSDLVAINPDVQFSFRESVEPVYREFVELLLQPSQAGGVPSQDKLIQARQVIESLQLAELENFFREACITFKPQQIDQIDPTAAVIYPIILPDRLAVILSLPGQPLSYYQTNLLQSKVEGTIEQLLQSLNPALGNKQRLRVSQEIYNWLIRPAQTQLAASGVKTLVFVLDGSLRNIPMAALYDGQQYLVEKYSIALSPGLLLLETRSLARGRLNALTAGLTVERPGFQALPGVKSELSQISSQVRSEVLLDQEFTQKRLEQQIRQIAFPIIHLATHAQFSSKLDDTFLLTWEGRINAKDFDALLRARERQTTNPIELLVLSACQTATGDKRATLGLAGLAVRSGARSTLATLWSVRDDSTAELMAKFYRELIQSGVSKAEALRQAQLLLLKQSQYNHPYYWAAFVLVGNWL